nr:hypothetical protein Iba_chr04aCG9140 [Ipomoea batatas]
MLPCVYKYLKHTWSRHYNFQLQSRNIMCSKRSFHGHFCTKSTETRNDSRILDI